MFIKWRHEETREGTTRWYAYLAESKRINGKPRQKVITYLAAIEQDRDGEWIHADTFWFNVTRSLCVATDVAPSDCSWAMDKVGERVPLPTYRQWSALIPDGYGEWMKQHSHLTKKARETEKAFVYRFEAWSENFSCKLAL